MTVNIFVQLLTGYSRHIALELVIRALELKGEVIIPSFTFLILPIVRPLTTQTAVSPDFYSINSLML
ncbi:hypothetical protein AA650_04345 [Anabaena sp. WA102]|jgi:hypothetical protein|uniref:Uncharacterized protein n=1 Tax=Dolichospermum flos-aquae UHCC 0037 TaxID=2590026 RepID=A0ACC7S3V8_DOLFA|nr:hypothetical protein AA650_04345 [Anabaena sp. WA102]MTJ42499.1 hypothetical protein [Dolichospermum flos-aquae UHCC 0037]